MLLGSIFAGIGLLLSVVFIANVKTFGVMVLIPLFFLFLGIGFMIPGFMDMGKNRKIRKMGVRYQAKIYSYTEDRSVLVNDSYPYNTIVHYFDESGTEREAILDTGFTKGSNSFPLGMTIDIYEYNGQIGWDRSSVRNEAIPREEELLDDIPVSTAGREITAVNCPACGASFNAVKGYASKCPYCGKHINA